MRWYLRSLFTLVLGSLLGLAFGEHHHARHRQNAESTCEVVIDKKQCDRSRCEELCSQHGSSYLMAQDKCCTHVGKTASLLAFEQDDEWVPRIMEFNKCTGASIRLEYLEEGEDGMAEAILRDVGNPDNPNSGEGIFDAYIAQAPWLPAVESGLADLSGLIREKAEYIHFQDINPASRDAISYNGTVKALPLDTDYIAIGWREDVFQKHGIDLQPPRTIEELANLSERLNGLDHNGDGEPDWGFCLTPQVNYFYAFVAPVFQTNLRECNGEDDIVCTKGKKTGQNLFFDSDTFEPLIWNDGFRYALEQYWRVIRSSNCPSQLAAGEKCDRKTAFPTGRCAGVISMPGTMTKMLKEGEEYSIQPRIDEHSSELSFWKPGQELTEDRYWGRRARFPGSSIVVNWDTATTGEGDSLKQAQQSLDLVSCTTYRHSSSSHCPHADNDVNYAPFFAEGGESYALNGRQSKPVSKEIMFDFFTWMAELPVTKLPLSGQYRKSHLDDEHRHQLQVEGWPGQMIDDLFDVLMLYFLSEEEGGNAAQDLLLLGFKDYMAALDKHLHGNFLLLSVEEGGVFDLKNESGSLDPQRPGDSELFDERYQGFVSNLAASYEEITSRASGGRLAQLQRWRQSLNLVWKPPERLCFDVLVDNVLAFDKLECASQVDFASLCLTDRGAVERYRPGICQSQEMNLNQIGIIRWVGWSMALIVIMLAIGFMTWTCSNRSAAAVRASQPLFLHVFCFGILVTSSAVFPLGIDDSMASLWGCNFACQSFPWLFFLGFTITFSALFSKIWRLNKLMDNAKNFKKILVTEWDVLWPFFGMMIVNVTLLIGWTFVDPLVWVRVEKDDANSYGTCSPAGRLWPIFFGLLVVVNVGALVLANFQAYRARRVSDELSESHYIGLGMISMLQMFFIAIPLLFVVQESPPAKFFLYTGAILITATSLLLLIFVPKVVRKRQDWRPAPSMMKNSMVRKQSNIPHMESVISVDNIYLDYRQEENDQTQETA